MEWYRLGGGHTPTNHPRHAVKPNALPILQARTLYCSGLGRESLETNNFHEGVHPRNLVRPHNSNIRGASASNSRDRRSKVAQGTPCYAPRRRERGALPSPSETRVILHRQQAPLLHDFLRLTPLSPAGGPRGSGLERSDAPRPYPRVSLHLR